MVDAARAARRAGNLPLAERLAAAATDAGAGPAAVLLHARVLGERGWHERARTLLAELAEAAGSPEERTVVAIERSRALLYWLGRGAEAATTLDEAAKDVTGPLLDRITAHRGLVALMRGRLTEALALADSADTAAPGEGLATAAATAAVAAALAGRTGAAQSFIQRAERGPEPGRARLAQVVALCESGRLPEADGAVTKLYERSLKLHRRTGQAWAAMLRGRIELLTGQLGRAEHAFAEGVAIAADIGQLGLRRWCAAGSALAAAQRGDTERAQSLMAELDALPPSDLDLLLSDELRARAWTAPVRGEAHDLLRQAAEFATESGAGALAAAAWHDLARLGAADADVARALSTLAAGSDNRLVVARAAVVTAMAAHDPDALAAAGDRFQTMGALLYAAEAVAAAAAEYRRRQDNRAAERAAERAHALADRCDRAGTPGLTLAGPAAELTSREREIASLAAEGRSNREIADALVVSVRTVETHLQRAYTKLGVTSRSGLATVLRSRGRKTT
jgi:ATP/maltotriose-dependent transcriptional regulator MalT